MSHRIQAARYYSLTPPPFFAVVRPRSAGSGSVLVKIIPSLPLFPAVKPRLAGCRSAAGDHHFPAPPLWALDQQNVAVLLVDIIPSVIPKIWVPGQQGVVLLLMDAVL